MPGARSGPGDTAAHRALKEDVDEWPQTCWEMGLGPEYPESSIMIGVTQAQGQHTSHLWNMGILVNPFWNGHFSLCLHRGPQCNSSVRLVNHEAFRGKGSAGGKQLKKERKLCWASLRLCLLRPLSSDSAENISGQWCWHHFSCS